MKKAILIAMVLLSAQAATVADAEERSLTVLLAGGPEADVFEIGLSPDGRTYTIDSAAPLEVGGEICWHPGGNPLQLLCEAPPITGLEVNAGDGDDVVDIDPMVLVPATLLGGPGNDTLAGARGNDKLEGESGHDRLDGRNGNDKLLGGPGADHLLGGPGIDGLAGEAGPDTLFGSFGRDLLVGGPGRDALYGGPGDDRLVGGAGDRVFGGPGNNTVVSSPIR